jgi:hypothetical protein
MNGEYTPIAKEALVTYLTALFRHSLEQKQETMKNLNQEGILNIHLPIGNTNILGTACSYCTTLFQFHKLKTTDMIMNSE